MIWLYHIATIIYGITVGALCAMAASFAAAHISAHPVAYVLYGVLTACVLISALHWWQFLTWGIRDEIARRLWVRNYLRR